MATAVNGWLLGYDNITAIPDWFSNSLCRLACGGGISGRTLYTFGERSGLDAQRPVILNGIEDYVRKSDLVDRTVFSPPPPSIHQNKLPQANRVLEAVRRGSIRADIRECAGCGRRRHAEAALALTASRDCRGWRIFALWGEAKSDEIPGWEPGSQSLSGHTKRAGGVASESSLEKLAAGRSPAWAGHDEVANWGMQPERTVSGTDRRRRVRRSRIRRAGRNRRRGSRTELRRLAPRTPHARTIVSFRAEPGIPDESGSLPPLFWNMRRK